VIQKYNKSALFARKINPQPFKKCGGVLIPNTPTKSPSVFEISRSHSSVTSEKTYLPAGRNFSAEKYSGSKN